MEEAFGAMRRRARAKGLRNFDVGHAIICLVALGYMPVAHRDTMVRRQGFRFDDDRFLAQRKRYVTDLMLFLLGATG